MKNVISGLLLAAMVGLLPASALAAPGPNLVPNASLEEGTTTPTSWSTVAGSNNTYTFDYPVAGQNGNKGARTTVLRYRSGDIGWQFANVPVTPGIQYEYTDYSNASVTSTVVARYTKTDGSVQTSTLGSISGNNTWKKFSAFLTVPAGTTSMTVRHVLRRTGRLDLDNFVLRVRDVVTPPSTYTLTTAKNGTGTGTVTGTGINCGSDCSQAVAPGTVVTLTATPAAGSTFAGWTGGSCTGTGTCAVTVNANTTVTATFNLIPTSTLTVAKNGTGTGTVTGTGINCGSDCTEVVNNGTSVTLTATPTAGSTFAGWTGGSCTGTGTCAVTVSANTTVTATFNLSPVTYTLTTAKNGTGTGTVTGTGINCGSDCSEVVPAGTIVTLTATPAAGSTFAGWTGGSCTGTGTCAVTVSANTTVTATFNLSPVSTGLPTNGDLETPSATPSIPQAWSSNSWGSLTATFTYPATGRTGSGAKVDVSGWSSGDAKWYFSHVPTTGGKTYTFKQDYLSNVTSNVTIEYLMADGTYQYGWLGDPTAAATWTTFEAQFTTPANTVSFTAFMALVGNGSITIDNASLTEMTGGALNFPVGLVSLAFDDTVISQYALARPILNAANIDASFYAITGSSDGIGSSGYMTWANITTLKNEGHEIGAHTRTHPDLTTLTSAQAMAEISGSMNDLIAHGIAPKTFTYPFGAFNAAVKQQVKDAGFIGARSVFDGYNTPTSDKFALLDKHIESNTTMADVQGWINQAVANKTWLIMELHEQMTNCGAELYCNTPTMLQSIVNAIQASGLQSVTLEQGIGMMQP